MWGTGNGERLRPLFDFACFFLMFKSCNIQCFLQYRTIYCRYFLPRKKTDTKNSWPYFYYLILDFLSPPFLFCVLSGTGETGGESSNFGTHRGCLAASWCICVDSMCLGLGLGIIKQSPFLKKNSKRVLHSWLCK